MKKENFFNDKKILFLMPDENDWFAKKIREKNFMVERIYTNYPAIIRALRKAYYSLNLPIKQIWYGKWVKIIKDYEIVIVFDSVFGMEILDYIRKKNKSCRIIFWYWNPVNKVTSPRNIKINDCELWSFDPDDCRRFNLKYNTQFYFNDILLTEQDTQIDILFVGRDKDRLKDLIKLKKIFEGYGLRCIFYILKDYKKYSSEEISYLKTKWLNYENILKLISKSKAILDITQDCQNGLTLKVLEALFFSKKLITNNTKIVTYRFYNKNNIFVIGIDDLTKIRDFLEKPYKHFDKSIIEQYSFKKWLDRFGFNDFNG